jgi:hypothetical protein
MAAGLFLLRVQEPTIGWKGTWCLLINERTGWESLAHGGHPLHDSHMDNDGAVLQNPCSGARGKETIVSKFQARGVRARYAFTRRL